MTRHSARATAALRALTETDPALAALSLWCAHRDVESGPMAMTHGTVIRYGPGFATLPLHEQTGLAAHHILHAALRHSARMAAMAQRQPETFDAATWNMAADAIVNEVLLAAGHALPRPALCLVDLLAQVAGESLPTGQALAEWDVDRLYVRLMHGPDSRDRAGTHAKARAFQPDLTPEAAPEPDGASAAEWRQHVTRAAQAGRMAGRGIGAMLARIADLGDSATPWEVILRRIITRAVTEAPRETHRRPARGWIAADSAARAKGDPTPAFQPGRQRQGNIPRIVVALDTSSSVDAPRVALFMAEVAGISHRTGAEVHVIAFDEAPEPALRLDPGRWQTQLAGFTHRQGGGTDFRPVMAAAARLMPSILIVMTDLDGPLPEAPRFPVLWAVPDAPVLPQVPFGKVITLAR